MPYSTNKDSEVREVREVREVSKTSGVTITGDKLPESVDLSRAYSGTDTDGFDRLSAPGSPSVRSVISIATSEASPTEASSKDDDDSASVTLPVPAIDRSDDGNTLHLSTSMTQPAHPTGLPISSGTNLARRVVGRSPDKTTFTTSKTTETDDDTATKSSKNQTPFEKFKRVGITAVRTLCCCFYPRASKFDRGATDVTHGSSIGSPEAGSEVPYNRMV